jgi:hypothetical protein
MTACPDRKGFADLSLSPLGALKRTGLLSEIQRLVSYAKKLLRLSFQCVRGSQPPLRKNKGPPVEARLLVRGPPRRERRRHREMGELHQARATRRERKEDRRARGGRCGEAGGFLWMFSITLQASNEQEAN